MIFINKCYVKNLMKFMKKSIKKLIKKINKNQHNFPKNISYFYLTNRKTSSNKYYSLIIILTCDSI